MLLQTIAGYLANTAVTNLQVGPRIRLSGGTVTNVPANSTLTNAVFTQNLPLLKSAGAAFWFEYVGGSIPVSATGLTITDFGLFFATAGNIFLSAGQPVITTLSPQVITSVIFALPSPLVQFEDLFQEANLAALTPAEPWQLIFRLTVKNGTAGIVSITPSLNIILRTVNGLQEG